MKTRQTDTRDGTLDATKVAINFQPGQILSDSMIVIPALEMEAVDKIMSAPISVPSSS